MLRFRISWFWLTVLAIVGAVVYGLFALGIFDWQMVRTKTRIATNQVSSDLKDAIASDIAREKATQTGSRLGAECRQNLRRIEAAKRQAARKKDQAVGNLAWEDVKPFLGRNMPVCPSGGNYTLGSLESMPRCSISSNGTLDHADDHILDNF